MKNVINLLFVFFFIIMFLSVNGQNLNKGSKEKAVHIVLFKFIDGTTTIQIQNLKNEILKQKGIIPGLLDVSFGEDFTGRAKGYTYAEVAIFKNKNYLEKFDISDYHKHLLATQIKPVLEDIIVLDYE